MSPASSRASPGTTATSSTTWSRRSCTVSPNRSGASCCRPPSSAGSAARCAMPSPARTAARRMLEALDRGNLFLVPLDDRRQWYRYHHLFADVLRARLLDEQPDRVPELHRRASEWYEQNGDRSEAIRHALAGEAYDRAADLVELAIPAMRRSRQEATLRGWLEALPDELIRVRPVLTIGLCQDAAGSRRARGRRGAPAGRRAVAGHDDSGAGGTERPIDRDGRRRRGGIPPSTEHDRPLPRRTGPGSSAMWPAPWHMPGGRSTSSAEDDHFERGAATLLSGTRLLDERGSRAGAPGLCRRMASLQRAGHVSDAVGGAISLADIRIAQGRLREAMTHLRAGIAARDRSGRARAARSSRHACGHERALPRTR